MGYVQQLDRRLTVAIGQLPRSWRPTLEIMTFLGEPLIVIAAGVGGYVAATLRHQPAVQRAFIYALLAFALGVGLKRVIHRSRPDQLILTSFGLKSYSFPSGHAFGSVIFYGLFAVIGSRHLNAPWESLWMAIILMAIVAIGVSRVYLGSHYPTDVIGGWIFGAIALGLIVSLTL
ncbi:phosphatase PAP2 family protein [Candidatus Saccharibacteria bacterium]|nr:phosphatase PAP2 family protein [Candidatus Saccharibacteria bacterium]